MPSFNLVPYPTKKIPNINISGEIIRSANQISIHYTVNGQTDQIAFPSPSTSPSRKDDLWKATCFEFFIAIQDQSKYWEFNMSPSGDWNVYIMDAYRQVNMREEKAFEQLLFEFNSNNADLSLNISVDVSPIIRLEQNLQIGIATIIHIKDKVESYWALAHPTHQADFHTRESFTLSL